MLAVAVLLLGLSAPASPQENDPIIAAHYMKLAYSCDGERALYRASKAAALRAVKQYDPSSYTTRDITGLDRGLRAGAVGLAAAIDTSDCENLLIEAKSDLDELIDKGH